MAKHLFQPGNHFGQGRPPRQTEAAYLGAMMAACPLDEWQAIVSQAVGDAKAGDFRAREWLAKYLVGEAAAKAPAPLQVVVQQMLGQDEALERAAKTLAKPILDGRKYPHSSREERLDEAVVTEAKKALLASEKRGETCSNARPKDG